MAFRGKVSKQYKVYGMNVMSCMQTPFEVKRLSRFRRFVEPKQEETKANAARRPGKAETAVKRQEQTNAKSNIEDTLIQASLLRKLTCHTVAMWLLVP